MDRKTCSDLYENNLSYNANEERSRRRRKTRSKFSSVNSRLDPNFDLRELLKQSEQETKSINEEINPRTMEFEKLVGLLHPAFVLEYLQKILHYLTSSMTKISFQNIALYKEVLLLRLCQDKSNLNCEKFNIESKKVAHQIVGVLKANQNVYEWTYKYDRGIFAPDVLVYEKVSTGNSNQKSTISNNVKDIGPLRPTNTANANGDCNTQDVQTTPSNKVDLFNTLLKFIKDSTRLKLVYPRVLKSQAEVLSSLINQGNIIDAEAGFGCKSLYAPLHAALDAHKQMFGFNVVFQEDSEVTMRMILQKIQRGPKNIQSAKQNSHGDQQTNTSKLSNASDGSQNLNPDKCPNQMTNLKGVGALLETFIRASLREILHFMEDESRASLHFAEVTMQEQRYLLRILQCFRNINLYQQFTPECRVLLRKIQDIYNNANWRLVIVNGKKDKDVGLHNVTMRKEPRYMESAVHVAPQSLAAQTATPVSTPRGTNTPAKAKPITFQSASHTDTSVDKDAVVPQRVTDAAKLVANSARKSKLLAAMSVPVESDVGERMMRLMGWRGGALGPRGEGITEPIIPPLHLAQGAGLGHVKQVKTTQSICEFRCQFLTSVLSFLRSRESETTLEYTESLERSKVRFVNRAIQNTKQRVGCGLSRLDEKELLEEVFDEMEKQSTQVEGSVSSPDNRKILLVKAPLTARKAKERKRKNNPDSTSKHPEPTPLKNQNTPVNQNMGLANECVIETITENHVDGLIERFDLDSKMDTPKTAKRLAKRLMFLTKLLNFLQMDYEKMSYLFDFELNKKLKSFISSVVTQVNKKASLCLKCENDMEHVICDRIRKATPQGCCLSCIFETKKFTLQKKVYQKRFTNSAHDLPPPKSTDLKNTIIYRNNKVINCNDVINDGDDDDDDVILVENDVEVIVISDDEGHEMEVDCVEVNTKLQTEYTDMPEIEEIDLKNKNSLDDLLISIKFTPDPSTSHENSKKPEVEAMHVKNEDSLDDSLISANVLQDLSTSREMLLLEMQDFKVKVESELDSEIRELEQAIIDCDIICDDEVVKPKQISCVKQVLETAEDKCKDLYLEINNNYNSMIVKNKLNLLVSDCMQQKKQNCVDELDCSINKKHTTDTSLEILPTFKNDNIIEIIENEKKGESRNSLQLIKEDNIKTPSESLTNAEPLNKSTDNSQLSTKDDHYGIEIITDEFQNRGKRSRSASAASEPESSSKRCKSQIRSVRITCKDANDELNTNFIRKVQSVVSESIDIIIDNVDFHPRLECHGVKNGGLVYSCYDDETFAWLTNSVVSDLDFNVTETDYPSETYKMEIKIYSFDDVDKILGRLMLYNPDLDTSLWRVIDKTELEDFVIIKVEIDKVSYNYVNKNNYSLFAGVDKAKFNVVWN